MSNPALPNTPAPEHGARARQDSPDLPKIEPGELFENDPARDRELPKRRLARERVLQALYAHALGGGDIDQLFFDLVEHDLREADERAAQSQPESNGALEFARELVREWTLHRTEISDLVAARLQRWDLSRIALIDRILMEMGVVELLYFPSIPPKATINELIEIAKDFSTEESGKFINGLLHAVMTQLTKEGRLQKAGRGLLESSPNGYRPAKGRKP